MQTFPYYPERTHTRPAKFLSLSELVALKPTVGAKDKAGVFTPYQAYGKTKPDAQGAQFYALVQDHDHDDLPRLHLSEIYDEIGCAYYAFTTSSHQQSGKGNRWKVVIPLSEPVEADYFVRFARGAAIRLNTDPAQVRLNQITYAPNVLTKDAPFEFIDATDRPFLVAAPLTGKTNPFAVQCVAAYEKEQAKKKKAAQAAKPKPRPMHLVNGSGGIIDKVCEQFDLECELEGKGYQIYGDSYLSPFSESGSPGVYILTGKDGKKRCYSHHGTSDPLSNQNHDGHALDVFDVICIFEYGGDVKKAVADLADKVDPDGQKQRQREYMAAQEQDARPFDELKSEASELTPDSDPDAIEKLVLDSAKLTPIKRRLVQDAIKKATGMPLTTQREAVRGEQEDEPDHLALAQSLRTEIGSENVLATPAFVWQWNDCGVWKPQADRAVRQWVQHFISDKVEMVAKSTVESVSDLFKTEVFKPEHQFDIGEPECVNCTNGELIHRSTSWTLESHNRENYRTTQVPIQYDAAAKAPRFERFLAEVFKDDADAQEKQQAILEMMGYSLMAHCRHERFVILVGSGANGKSVLLAVLEAMAGADNVAGVQPSQFDNKFQRAHLHRKLVNIVTEIKQGEVIDDASLKGIVSGEPTDVEHKFKDPFTMRPFATCWFGTNHMPHTRDFSDALFRRALVVEFNQVFKPELGNCDPMLKDKLMDELPGILSLSLGAYSKALEKGFTMPASCDAARQAWRLEADQVAQFIEDACEKVSWCKETPNGLYLDYKHWADINGIQRRMSLRGFTDRLKNLGYESKKSNGKRVITGLKPK